MAEQRLEWGVNLFVTLFLLKSRAGLVRICGLFAIPILLALGRIKPPQGEPTKESPIY